jgi:hypothetical protein
MWIELDYPLNNKQLERRSIVSQEEMEQHSIKIKRKRILPNYWGCVDLECFQELMA